MRVALTPDIVRGYPLETAELTVRHSIAHAGRGIVGVGLGGSEGDYPAGLYARAFAQAKEGGLGSVPHAGEADGPDSVAAALDTLAADRIRHGIRAVEDPGLLRELADRGIVLDVCPTSNVRTGVVRSLAEHPLPELLAADVRCTVNTDDPAMFGSNLDTEFAAALRSERRRWGATRRAWPGRCATIRPAPSCCGSAPNLTGMRRVVANLSPVAKPGILRRPRPALRRAGLVALLAALLALLGLGGCSSPAHHVPLPDGGIHKIRHVVIIMQENRSFDSFFGTYPGADGIPARNGRFTVCVPDPRTGGCDRPYHDPSLVNGGGGHSPGDARTDIAAGKMNGFVRSAELASNRGCSATYPTPRVCLPSGPPDVMGYHDAREIPNYWTYARDFVLNDHHVRAGPVVEPAGSPVPGQRLGRGVQERESVQLHQLHRRPGRAAAPQSPPSGHWRPPPCFTP